MHYLYWIGRAFYWACIALALILLLSVLVAAVRANHLDYMLSPIWVAAILYVVGLTVRNWTAARYPKDRKPQAQ